MDSCEVVEGETDLFEVILALASGCCFPDLLDGWEEESDEDGDDGDHHQEFDEGETFSILHVVSVQAVFGRTEGYFSRIGGRGQMKTV